ALPPSLLGRITQHTLPASTAVGQMGSFPSRSRLKLGAFWLLSVKFPWESRCGVATYYADVIGRLRLGSHGRAHQEPSSESKVPCKRRAASVVDGRPPLEDLGDQ